MRPFTQNHYRKTAFLLMVIATLFLTACMSMPTHQAYEGLAKADHETATFIVPEAFNLLAIDGTEYSKLGGGDGAIVKTLPGSHQFIVKYQGFWDLPGDNFERIESKPISITIMAKADNQYHIDSSTLKNIEQARLFAGNPEITIINKTSGQVISAGIKYNLFGRALFNTVFGPAKTEPVQAAPVASGTINPAIPPNVTSESATKSAANNKALEMLKYWWESADKDQQENFRQWMGKQTFTTNN